MAVNDAFLFGRKAYGIFACHWPTAPADDRYAIKPNGTPKFVVSKTLKTVDWQNSTLLTGDVAEELPCRRTSPASTSGVLGSSPLVHSIIANDLVDEYSLAVFPIVLGSGETIFHAKATRFRSLATPELSLQLWSPDST